MRIAWGTRGGDGRFRLEATPGPYDGVPPINALLLESEPLYVHDDVLAVVSILLFGGYCGGELNLPRQVSPEVASAIQRYCEPAWVSVAPINFEPRGNLTGDGSLFLSSELSEFRPRSLWGEPRISTIISLDSGDFAGSLASSDGLITNSNAAAIGQYAGTGSILAAHVAVALMYAETYFARRIIVSDTLVQGVRSSDLGRVQRLLESCKVSLIPARTLDR